MLGRSSSSSPNEPEPFTTQRLRAAVTPERVAAMRSATVNEVCTNLKQLTMRMYMLLAAGQHKQEFFRDSIEAVVNEYGEYGLLLHVAADWVSLQIGAWHWQQEPCCSCSTTWRVLHLPACWWACGVGAGVAPAANAS